MPNKTQEPVTPFEILIEACKQVVYFYENSGHSDPTDTRSPWRICHDALKKAGVK